MPATEGLPVAWLPDWDIAAMTIVRPVPWARSLGDLAFRPERWGNRLIRIAAPGGTHLLIRRHAAPELALWVPAGLEPKQGGPFGLYLERKSVVEGKSVSVSVDTGGRRR